MKKFILLCVAFLSAIGVQAGDISSITHNGVTYGLTKDSQKSGTPTITSSMRADKPNVTNAKTLGANVYVTETWKTVVTTTYNASAVSINNSKYNVELVDFSDTIKNNPVKTEVYDTIDYNHDDYAIYFNRMKAAGFSIYSSDDLSANASSIGRFYYPVYDDWDGTYNWFAKGDLDFYKDVYPDWNKVFYAILTKDGNTSAYPLPYVYIKTEREEQITDAIVCNVTLIDQSCKLNSNATSVILGQKIHQIPDNSFFANATQLALIVVEPGNNYLTYENGILYGNFYAGGNTGSQETIITGTTTTISQTIPETVKTVYTDAFKNAPEGVIITCMNYQLTINGNDNYVIFLLPSTQAQIQGGKNGGYIIEGNLTQAHIDQLEIKGTFMDFTEANILSNIHFNNGSNPINTLLYFSNPANSVTGDKNVIIDGQCDSCVITDNGSDEFYCPTAFRAKKLTYTRKFDDMWKTTSLPFSLPSSKLKNKLILGELNDFYYEYYYMYDFLYSTSINAYVPYIVKAKEVGDTVKLENLENIDIEVTAPIEYSFDEDRGKFIPVFKTQVLTSSTAAFNYYGIQNIWKEEQNCWGNHIQIFEGVTIRPFRAYLVGPKMDSSVAKYRLLDANNRVIEEGEFDVTSAIETVKSVETENTKATYNLNGQRVNNTLRGLNVIDGKVILNK